MLHEPASATLLQRIVHSGVAAAHPGLVLQPLLPVRARGRVIVVGGGKAAHVMAAAVEASTPIEQALTGLVIAPHGSHANTTRIEIAHGAHPVSDAAGMAHASRMLQLVDDAGPDDRVLALISGGGSALMALPLGVSTQAWTQLLQALLASGADIRELNLVRRRLSASAGGRLAARAWPAQVHAFLVSDVLGDDPFDIASGPCTPETDADAPHADARALAVLARYGMDNPEVVARLQAGALDVAPSASDPRWRGVQVQVVASADLALRAMAHALAVAGWTLARPPEQVEGDADAVANMHAAWVAALEPSALPRAIVTGGETTVTLRSGSADTQPAGRGGRNSTFAAALARHLPADARVWAIAMDSDGIDGVGGHAGAWIDPDFCARVPKAEIDAAIDHADTLTLFETHGRALVTGPTGTNVSDLRVLLIEPTLG